ncbi:KICSTOR complex protein SZT2 isoform X8 [Myxocyprinus asiaticus]|uniref:KICSTOR complex protein SZT2 isoform X8 n=1 Tax=Myxocyprinus asiaticus TaxID=70543 RepID=UPI0022226ED9|nr:KICSTOR complex protein SZT2 isoform X8 [Myxocyprinus asiaticus]
MAERQYNEVEEAEQVYLLMKEEYRISRNVRLSWFLNRLNQVIRPCPQSELLKSENELDILSILPKGWQPDSPPSSCSCLLVPSTRVTFLARRYRFIIELDLSPSTGIVDDSTGEMIFDEVFHALSRCLAGLARPCKVPGTDHEFRPEIFITILAYSSIIGLCSHQVLVQGCQLHCMDLDQFLHQIYQQLRAMESNIAEVLQQQHNQLNGSLYQSFSNDVVEEVPQRKPVVSMVTADVGLVSMVRQGILALQLLPPNSGAGIIIITDGVMSVPDVAVCETLLNQLRSGTITCSFVQVGGAYSYDCSFGYIPNVELMKFISMATFGSYLSSCPEPDCTGQEMNAYHRAFLTYSFLRTGESMNPEYYCFSQHRLFNEHLVSASGNPALVMRRKKHTEKEVHADLISVLSIRLREGYTIREINITKGGTQLELKLVLLWKHNMRIEYLAMASWPLDPAKRTTWVEVTIEGSYDILHDISCTMRKPITSPYRMSVIRRFWNTLQSINQTDQMLVHLQSFNSIPEHYTIPESTKNGVPLFYIPPGSTTPVLSLQHSGSKDSSQSQFASYWKPILSMDANFWQRWLHMHRIAIILEHDIPVPKHVHNAGCNGRFSTIQCRISHSALTSLLRAWSSFVLVEGYSYIKLIYSASELPPISFYLVRLISKPPCMVLRLGFPIGTLAHTRNKIVDELREQILQLRFPHRVQNKEATPKIKRKILGNASPSKSPPLPAPNPALSDRPCVVVHNKPLEKLLIRYEKLPSDFCTPFILNMEPFAQPLNMGAPLSMAASRTASSTVASLSRYFLHQRWVWAVQNGPGTAVSLQAVAHILSMLSEIRISEGFHFAASGEGIVSMVTELPMQSLPTHLDRKNHTCIVQYILFPPHSTSTKDSFSTDDDNDTEVEAIDVDTELSLVTECWVEPQSGAVCSSLDQHRHFQNLTYQEIPQAIFPRDVSCMSTMVTFEYLIQLCQNKEQVCPLKRVSDAPDEVTTTPADDCIHTVPFQFDLLKLLPKCQQIELFFYTFSREEHTDSTCSASSLPNDLLLSLFHSSLQNELSDREIPLADGDHVAFMHHILERERDGHVAPFSLPVIKEECLKPPERQETVLSFHTISISKEVTGSSSTLQSFSNADLADDESAGVETDEASPHWKCYVKYISHQQILLTFLPATFTDVQLLTSSGLETEPPISISLQEEEETCSHGNGQSQTESISSFANGPEDVGRAADFRISEHGKDVKSHSLSKEESTLEPDTMLEIPTEQSNINTSATEFAVSEEKDGVQFMEPQKRDCHITFSRQVSQQSSCNAARPCCPIYIYNCSLASLKDQLVHPQTGHQPKDVFYRPQETDCWEFSQQSRYRSISQERSSSSSWTELMAHPHKHKELANYCSLLQEHYYQSYVRGVYRSLQQSYSVSSQDILTAMDYCEESLQEIDITSFLQTLCGHIRVFREHHELHGCVNVSKSSNGPATFLIGEGEDDAADRATLVPSSSVELEDVSEADSRGKLSVPTSPLNLHEPKSPKILEFPLSLLQSQQKCEVNPDLHKIIQDKFMEIGAQYFKTVPSNPHYFFYCPPSSKKEEDTDRERERKASEECEVSEAELATEDENMSGCCIVTESDMDLEVEYQECGNGKAETREQEAGEGESSSDSNTMNQDEDFFSILDGDSLLDTEGAQPEMPPLFVHLTCSVNMKSCHGSMPTQTLPTCLGEVITCLENAENLQSVDLNDLSVTLDIFVLTLPVEIEVLAPDFCHNRYTSESSMSLNRSPGQPSSYRSDEELMGNLDGLRGGGEESMSGDLLSKLPVPHKMAVLATMDEIRWLLEDEIVSALRHSSVINSSTLQKVSKHVCRSSRPQCHCEVVPLQFVFGPEQSLEKFQEEFRRLSFPGYLLNTEQDNFHYVSLSRQQSHRIQAARQLTHITAGCSTGTGGTAQQTNVCPKVDDGSKVSSNLCTSDKGPDSDGESKKKDPDTDVERDMHQEGDGEHGQPKVADFTSESLSETFDPGQIRQTEAGETRSQSAVSSTAHLQMGSSTEHPSDYTSPPKTPSAASLAESMQSTTHSSGKLRPSRVQSVVSSQGSLDSDMLGYDGGSSDSECDGPTMNEQERLTPLMPDFWLIIRIHQDRVEVFSHSRSLNREKEEEEEEIPEYLRLHQLVVRRIGEMCRIVNQRLLLQDLHDSHVCHSLLVAESEEDIWKHESLYRPRKTNSDGAAMHVRFDVWEQGNISPLQLMDRLRAALQHALCDVVMEMHVLPNPLCLETFCLSTAAQRDESTVSLSLLQSDSKEVKESLRQSGGAHTVKSNPTPITLISAPSSTPATGSSTPESTTPTGKTTRRSFWELLSKPETSELSSLKTTDDIIPEREEDSRMGRRRHKTENVKQQWNHEKAMAVEQEQAQRRHAAHLEEGDTGTLHPVYQTTYLPWVTFMNKLNCPSVQHCAAEISHHFLLPSILTEIVNLVSSLANDTTVKVFERTSCPQGDIFSPLSIIQHISQPPATTRSFILIGRNFSQWHCSSEQAHKGLQRFEALEHSDWLSPGQAVRGVAPRQRFLYIHMVNKKVTMYTYNWSVDLGSSLNQGLVRLVHWHNARAHVVNCLLSQKMGLFHHYCFSDTPAHDELKQEPNPFLNSTSEADALLRSPVPPVVSKDQGRLGSSARSLPPLAFPGELVPFDEALRDVNTVRPLANQDGADIVAWHGAQLLEVKSAERRELERQMKIENLFVTWQQRSAQSNMPISVADLDTLKLSSRLAHYCATPLLFDPVFRKQIQEEQIVQPQLKKRHRSSDSTVSGRDRSHSTDSADMLPSRLKNEPWLQDISNTFLQQYVQYLQSMGFILVQVRPQSPARSIARARATLLNSLSTEGRSSFSSFSYNKQKSEDSPKQSSSGSSSTSYHLQRALPGGIVLMELAFQGCYFCVKQFALECSRIPMGQTVNSQDSLLNKPPSKPFPETPTGSDSALSMLFTEECDKVCDLMHVHSFSYDFHLRVVHQYLLGCHMTLRQGYQLTSFLEDFIAHHPDIPKFGHNHVFQGSFSISTGMITAHQLYNYITDHAGTYGMKPLRMSKAAVTTDNKKGASSTDLHVYALVALWNSSGSFKDMDGLRHHDDFDVSMLVCHNAAPFEEQSEGERHLLRLQFYVIMTSQRELFPRLTADMRRFKKLPQIYRDPGDLSSRTPLERMDSGSVGAQETELDLWEETTAPVSPATSPESDPLVTTRETADSQGLFYLSPVFPLLNSEVLSARRQIQSSVEQAMGHCRRDNLWRMLFHGEHLALDKLKLSKLAFGELEELLNAVQSRSVAEIDPQLDCFLNMSPAWYQSLIKVLLSRFPQNCRHFKDDGGIQYLAVLNQKFTDCFVLVFLDAQAGKTSLKIVFREPLSAQTQSSSSPPPQLVSMYHHLESVINTACYNLWTGLL